MNERSVSTPSNSHPEPPEAGNRSTFTTVAIVALSAAVVGGGIYFSDRIGNLENELKMHRAAMKSEVMALHTDSTSRMLQHEQRLADLRLQMEQSGAKSYAVANQASTAAKRYSDALAKRLAEEQTRSAQSHDQLLSQLGEMKQSASAASDQLTGIAGDVSNVRTEVLQTRTQLDKTISDLRSVRGDLGLQSGLIATNAQELAALRSLGDREYFEFELMKTKSPQKVGEVAVQLKKWDARRNRYTIDLLADDKRVEKKDRSINEPVQFYANKARMPYEIVVNEVRKDRIVGYLAAPKLKTHAGLSRSR